MSHNRMIYRPFHALPCDERYIVDDDFDAESTETGGILVVLDQGIGRRVGQTADAEFVE